MTSERQFVAVTSPTKSVKEYSKTNDNINSVEKNPERGRLGPYMPVLADSYAVSSKVMIVSLLSPDPKRYYSPNTAVPPIHLAS